MCCIKNVTVPYKGNVQPEWKWAEIGTNQLVFSPILQTTSANSGSFMTWTPVLNRIFFTVGGIDGSLILYALYTYSYISGKNMFKIGK